MENSVVVQLKGLEREKTRLDTLLAADENWRQYKESIDAFPGRPETEVATEISLPESVATALDNNRLFQARRKILEAIDLLEDLLAKPGSYQPPAFQHPDAIAATEPARPAAEPFVADDHADSQPESLPEQDTKLADADPPSSEQDASRTKEKVELQEADLDAGDVADDAAGGSVSLATEANDDVDLAPASGDGQSGGGSLVPHLLPSLARTGFGGGSLAVSLQLSSAGAEGSHGVTAEPRPAEMEPEVDAAVELTADSLADDDEDTTAQLANTAATLQVSAANDDQPDDLLSIKGMTSADVEVLARGGVFRFAQVASWTAADVRRLRKIMGDSRVSSEQWIEQAAMLAQARPTAFMSMREEQPDDVAARYPFTQLWSYQPPRSEDDPSADAAELEAREDTTDDDDVSRSVQPPLNEPQPEPTASVARVEAESNDDVEEESAAPATSVSSMHDEILEQAEVRRTALNERIARLEQTISTIVMPDLKRPPPDLVGRGTPPPEDVPTPQPLPPPSPPRPEDLMADLPPLDTPPRGLGFDDEFGFDDEADVQIITTDDELGGAASQQGRFHDPQRLPLPDHPHDQSSNWTPDHLARRLDRLDGSAEDTLTALARYSGEVEEASVEIVRKPKPSTVEPEPSTLATNSAPSDLPPAAGLASPAPEQTKQSDRPMPPREQVGTPAKRRSRRFLSALIGGDRDS